MATPQSTLDPNTLQQLKTELADVVEPASISFWPPAVGWWVVAFLLVLTLALLLRAFYQRRKQSKNATGLETKKAALNALYKSYASSDQATYVDSANAILKRFCLVNYTHPKIAQASGDEWVKLLDQIVPNTLTDATKKQLAYGRYQPPSETSNTSIEAVHEAIKKWLKEAPIEDFTQTEAGGTDA